MKSLLSFFATLSVLFMSCAPNLANAAMTVANPVLSPSLGEYDTSKVTDENGNKFPIIMTFLPGPNGQSGIASNKLIPGQYSSVTGRQSPPLFKAAGGKYVPVYALASVDLTNSVAGAFSTKIASILCNASVGGSQTETLTCTGLLPTDIILALTQKTPGSNGTATTRYDAPSTGAVLVGWTGNPGSGSIVNILVKHQ